MKLKVLTEGDERLRVICKPVTRITPAIKKLIADMIETMYYKNGVGLAAPQVGIMRRMFVAEPEPERVYIFVDPEMISLEGEQEGTEGCLSVPGYVGTVKRPEKIVIRGKDRYGKEKEYTFEGFDAVVMCHEFDHLEGILYTDKATELFKAEELEAEEQE